MMLKILSITYLYIYNMHLSNRYSKLFIVLKFVPFIEMRNDCGIEYRVAVCSKHFVINDSLSLVDKLRGQYMRLIE